MNRLTGKIAVITGGTQGLGATIARLFADRGASGIVTCGRSVAKGQAKAQEIQDATGTKAVFVAADLGKIEDCRAVIAKADAEFGRVDVLVNAAAITDRGPFFLMQETIKIMRREKIEGNIVNICSMSSKAGQPFIAAYCSSKGALATLTKNTAYAVMRNRIRVNGLNIGWMATEGEDRIQAQHHGASPDWLKEAAAAQPFGRLVDPHEVARAVAFLSTDESGLMTGSMVIYDQSIWGAYDSSPQPESAL